MSESRFKSYDDLPLFLSVQELAEVLGVSRAVAYDLVRQETFPSINIGNRIVIPREKFLEWVDRESAKQSWTLSKMRGIVCG